MRTFLIVFIAGAFLVNTLGSIPAGANEFVLPKPGTMVHLSPAYHPPILKGIKVHPDDPFKFEFVLDVGAGLAPAQNNRATARVAPTDLKSESQKLIKYFLAALTIPEKDLWVNLSPYEKDRIVPDAFGQTEMGRDLLAQDYMLKQITASLIYPEDEVGKKFWKRIYEEAAKRFGTTNISVNTFNKVWILPEKAVVYENSKAGTAFVVESRLKVMLEEDYLSLTKNTVGAGLAPAQNNNDVRATARVAPTYNINQLGSEIVREVVIPALTKEINEGQNFAQLRQVYNSLILAQWYKKKIKDSILSQVYSNKKKIAGVNLEDPQEKQKIYERYLQAFKKGAYNYIKEETDPVTRKETPRKYFSGGMQLLPQLTYIDLAMNSDSILDNDKFVRVESNLAMIGKPTLLTTSVERNKIFDEYLGELIQEEIKEGHLPKRLIFTEIGLGKSNDRQSLQPSPTFYEWRDVLRNLERRGIVDGFDLIGLDIDEEVIGLNERYLKRNPDKNTRLVFGGFEQVQHIKSDVIRAFNVLMHYETSEIKRIFKIAEDSLNEGGFFIVGITYAKKVHGGKELVDIYKKIGGRLVPYRYIYTKDGGELEENKIIDRAKLNKAKDEAMNVNFDPIKAGEVETGFGDILVPILEEFPSEYEGLNDDQWRQFRTKLLDGVRSKFGQEWVTERVEEIFERYFNRKQMALFRERHSRIDAMSIVSIARILHAEAFMQGELAVRRELMGTKINLPELMDMVGSFSFAAYVYYLNNAGYGEQEWKKVKIDQRVATGFQRKNIEVEELIRRFNRNKLEVLKTLMFATGNNPAGLYLDTLRQSIRNRGRLNRNFKEMLTDRIEKDAIIMLHAFHLLSRQGYRVEKFVARSENAVVIIVNDGKGKRFIKKIRVFDKNPSEYVKGVRKLSSITAQSGKDRLIVPTVIDDGHEVVIVKLMEQRIYFSTETQPIVTRTLWDQASSLPRGQWNERTALMREYVGFIRSLYQEGYFNDDIAKLSDIALGENNALSLMDIDAVRPKEAKNEARYKQAVTKGLISLMLGQYFPVELGVRQWPLASYLAEHDFEDADPKVRDAVEYMLRFLRGAESNDSMGFDAFLEKLTHRLAEKPVVILLGMPASGKGMAGDLLSGELGVPTVSFGEVARLLVKHRQENQEQVTDVDVIHGIRAMIEAHAEDFADGFVLDFTFSLPETYHGLIQMLRSMGFSVSKLVYVKTEQSIAHQRYLDRGLREDVQADNFERRVNRFFYPVVMPVIEEAERAGKLVTLDNNGEKERLKQSVKDIVPLLEWKHSFVGDSKADPAQKANEGGIDFTSDKALTVQDNGQAIRLHIDPAMLKELQNAPGFTPVIINIQPMTNIREFLGLNSSSYSS